VAASVLSRNKNDLGGKFPDVKDSMAALGVEEAIVDGKSSHWTRKAARPFNYSKVSIWVSRGHQSPLTGLICSSSTCKNLQNLPIEGRKAKLEEMLKILRAGR
jgi:ATP-dependent DNA ligase